MNWSFKDKVALVTGAASGIGLATAKAFAEAGAADVHEDAVRSAVDELSAASHKAIAVSCNVADEAEVAAMVEQTVSVFGRLDAAFNNAGVQSPAVETADVTSNKKSPQAITWRPLPLTIISYFLKVNPQSTAALIEGFITAPAPSPGPPVG